MLKIWSDLFKTCLKIYYFCKHLKKGQKMAKWPNSFISGKQLQKRPNGNPGLETNRIQSYKRNLVLERLNYSLKFLDGAALHQFRLKEHIVAI